MRHQLGLEFFELFAEVVRQETSYQLVLLRIKDELDR